MTNEEYQRLELEFQGIRDETGIHQNTAVRIGTAFLDLLRATLSGEFDEISFNKVINKPEFLQGLIALGTIVLGQYAEGLQGGIITPEGAAELKDLWVREHAKIGDGTTHYDAAGRVLPALEVKGDSTFTGNLSSPEFVSDFFGGLGWSIKKNEVTNAAGVVEYKYTLEIDNAVIRNTLRVFEMIISQLLGENANRYFSDQMEVDHYDPETGKVWLKTANGRMYNPFRIGDIIEVQQYNGEPSEENDWYVTKAYELRITAVGMGALSNKEDRLDWVEFDSFVSVMEGGTPRSLIKEFDTFVRADNDRNPSRKGIVTVMAVGENTPYMDVHYAMKTDPKHSLKSRIGNLQGVRTDLFGWLEGFGAYINNMYGVGKFFNAQTGESLTATMRMTREIFKRVYSETTFNIPDEDNFLSNGFFQEDMKDWTKVTVSGSDAPEEEEVKVLAVDEGDGPSPLLVNGVSMAVSSKNTAQIEEKEGILMLHLLAMGVAQDFSVMKEKGTHRKLHSSTPSDTQIDTEGDSMFMGVRILPVTSGRLSVRFMRGSRVQSWETDIEDSLEWQLVQHADDTSDPWDWTGSGRLVISYTGECYIRFVALTTDPVANAREDYSTIYEQNSRRITLAASKAASDLAEARAEINIEFNRIDQAVADNWSAFQTAKTNLEGEVSRIDQAVLDYASQNNSRWASFATWQSQTNTSISSFAAALTVDGEIIAMSAWVQTVLDIQSTVADNWSAFQTAKTNLETTISSVDTRLTQLNTDQGNKWASFATWQNQTNTSISSFATALSVNGQIMSMSSVIQTCNSIDQRVTSNYNSLDARISALSITADSISGRVTSVEGWGSTISSHSTYISSLESEVGALQSDMTGAQTTLGQLNTKIGGFEAWKNETSMWVSNVNSELASLMDPTQWEDGTVSDSEGHYLEFLKGNMTGYIRYYSLVPVTVATCAMAKQGYLVKLVYFNSNKLSFANSGWRMADAYGRITFDVPNAACYAAIIITTPNQSPVITHADAPKTGFFISHDNILAEAYMKVLIDDWGTSHAKIKADRISFDYGEAIELRHNGELIVRLSADGRIYWKGSVTATKQYDTFLNVNDWLTEHGSATGTGTYDIDPDLEPYSLFVGCSLQSKTKITLPSASENAGLVLKFFSIKKTSSAQPMSLAGTITYNNSSNVLQSASEVYLNVNQMVTVVSIESSWHIIAGNVTPVR